MNATNLRLFVTLTNRYNKKTSGLSPVLLKVAALNPNPHIHEASLQTALARPTYRSQAMSLFGPFKCVSYFCASG